MDRPVLASIEYVVEDLDKALEFFVDLVGLELVNRGTHESLAADTAMVSAGSVAITLLQATDDPERVPLAFFEPGVSQVVFMLESDDELIGLRDRLIDAGAAVVSDSPQAFHISQPMIEGVFGRAPVPVFVVPPSPGV